LIEAYRDRDAMAAHKLTAHYAAWVEKAEHMFAETRTRALFENVFPGDHSW
jgi:quinol monooxygenase YgiN